GTQFNVRTLEGATDVAVVEGVVQVTVTDATTQVPTHAPSNANTPANSSAPTRRVRLAAGERVEVSRGEVERKNTGTDVSDAVLWRQRRVKFRDTSLADAAAEFNRYNDVQILVDPS